MSARDDRRPEPADRGRWLVPAALVFALATTTIVVVDGLTTAAVAVHRSQEFQQLLGGFGTAPATSLSSGPHSMDVRLGRTPYERDKVMRAAATWEIHGAPRVD